MENITLEFVAENYSAHLEMYAKNPAHDKSLLRLLERKEIPEKLFAALVRILEKLAYQEAQALPTQKAQAFPTEKLQVEDVKEASYETLQDTANKITDALFDENGKQKILGKNIDSAVGDAVQKAVAISHAIAKHNKKRASIEKMKLLIAELEKERVPDLQSISEKKNLLGQMEIEKKTLDIRIDGYKAK
jgi:hypothetical protein